MLTKTMKTPKTANATPPITGWFLTKAISDVMSIAPLLRGSDERTDDVRHPRQYGARAAQEGSVHPQALPSGRARPHFWTLSSLVRSAGHPPPALYAKFYRQLRLVRGSGPQRETA